MPAETDLHPTTVVAGLVARRAVRSVIPWAYVFAAYVFGSVSGYAATYKTAASRAKLARSLGANTGLRALLGPARYIDTVAGFAAWRCLGVLSLVGAVWALLAGTKLLRGEEEGGRWEVLLAGQTTRRQAASLAGGVLGVAFVIRMVADSGSHLQWVLWASPLGWVEELRPLTGSRPVALLPIIAFVALLSVLTVRLAEGRDVGASILPDRDSSPPHTRLLNGPTGLAVRLTRPVALGWITAIGAFGLLFGLVAQSAANASSGVPAVEKALGRLGGRQGGAAAYLGLTFLIIAALVALVVAGQVTAAREEEADGRLDNLLVRPVSRPAWLTGRLVIAAVVALLCGVAAGLLAWVGAASQQSGVSFRSLVQAGINTVPPALLLLGLGALVHAIFPRAVAATTYGLVGWSFLVELIGSVVKLSHWILDTSLLYHVAPAPATNPHWDSAAILVGLGLVATLAANVIFAHRDLINA